MNKKKKGLYNENEAPKKLYEPIFPIYDPKETPRLVKKRQLDIFGE